MPTTMPYELPCKVSSMNSDSPLDRSTIFLSGFAPKRLRFFADRAAKKWPLRGSLRRQAGVAIPCLDDGSAEHSLSGSAERQLRLRGSHRPERLFPDGP